VSISIVNKVVLYQIDNEKGGLQKMTEQIADYEHDEPEVKKSVWSRDNSLLATGGEDGVARVWTVNKAGEKGSNLDLKWELR